jgi:hypothetical protein
MKSELFYGLFNRISERKKNFLNSRPFSLEMSAKENNTFFSIVKICAILVSALSLVVAVIAVAVSLLALTILDNQSEARKKANPKTLLSCLTMCPTLRDGSEARSRRRVRRSRADNRVVSGRRQGVEGRRRGGRRRRPRGRPLPPLRASVGGGGRRARDRRSER